AGARGTLQITYDNSESNPRNRSRPPRRVIWGPRSSDEMGTVWLKVLPVRAADAAILLRDAAARAFQADLPAAELRVQAEPTDGVVHNVLGTRYLKAGRLPDAVAQFEAALRLQPGEAEAHSNLGSALQLQGRIDAAMPHLREAIRLAPAS